MTAARVELLSALLMLRVGGGRIGGDGMALDRVSRHVRRKTHCCVGGRHIVQKVWEKSRGRICCSMLDFVLVW